MHVYIGIIGGYFQSTLGLPEVDFCVLVCKQQHSEDRSVLTGTKLNVNMPNSVYIIVNR